MVESGKLGQPGHDGLIQTIGSRICDGHRLASLRLNRAHFTLQFAGKGIDADVLVANAADGADGAAEIRRAKAHQTDQQ